MYTLTSFIIVSNKHCGKKNKLSVNFNFEHEYTGKISEKADIMKPSVKLIILETMVVTDG